jgi:hypothetical protein
MGETKHTYAICWTYLFNKHFFGPAARRVYQAHSTYLDRKSPDYTSYRAYLANVTMTPEIRRNAHAILALRPHGMGPTDESAWSMSYGMFLGWFVRPVGIPGLDSDYPDPVEKEWVVGEREREYLGVLEAAQAPSARDGVYAAWFDGFRRWVLGPPPSPNSNSFVFDLVWEPGTDGNTHGLAGVVLVDGRPTIPPRVRAFLDRYEKTMPRAIGREDSTAWMKW